MHSTGSDSYAAFQKVHMGERKRPPTHLQIYISKKRYEPHPMYSHVKPKCSCSASWDKAINMNE